jgi:hypothetical protein
MPRCSVHSRYRCAYVFAEEPWVNRRQDLRDGECDVHMACGVVSDGEGINLFSANGRARLQEVCRSRVHALSYVFALRVRRWYPPAPLGETRFSEAVMGPRVSTWAVVVCEGRTVGPRPVWLWAHERSEHMSVSTQLRRRSMIWAQRRMSDFERKSQLRMQLTRSGQRHIPWQPYRRCPGRTHHTRSSIMRASGNIGIAKLIGVFLDVEARRRLSFIQTCAQRFKLQ